MELPIKVFEIKGFNGEYVKMEISKIYGYPDQPSFRGGYDIVCHLTINSGVYHVESDHYSSTGALYNFYIDLHKCYDVLNGTAKYEVYIPDPNDLTIVVKFDDGDVTVTGKYQDDLMTRNVLEFEFRSDQSYFSKVLNDLKAVVTIFGGNIGF